jgi:hypothetical protein
METKDIIILVAVLAFASVRLYQKYAKSKKNKDGNQSVTNAENKSIQGNDDYEPYSGH